VIIASLLQRVPRMLTWMRDLHINNMFHGVPFGQPWAHVILSCVEYIDKEPPPITVDWACASVNNASQIMCSNAWGGMAKVANHPLCNRFTVSKDLVTASILSQRGLNAIPSRVDCPVRGVLRTGDHND
jgi:hypothetical protein